jgi:hypothetical protein
MNECRAQVQWYLQGYNRYIWIKPSQCRSAHHRPYMYYLIIIDMVTQLRGQEVTLCTMARLPAGLLCCALNVILHSYTMPYRYEKSRC